MTDEKNMGLRQKVKKGIVSIDEAIEIAKEYNENIQNWLGRRKDAKLPDPKKQPSAKKTARHKKRKKKKSKVNNAVV